MLRSELAAVAVANVALREENHHLREQNQVLRDEVARLKGQKGKPPIGPSRLNNKERRKGRRRRRRSRPARVIDRTEVVKATGVPDGSRFKGYSDFDVQELVIKTETIRYHVEHWTQPERCGRRLSRSMASLLASATDEHLQPLRA